MHVKLSSGAIEGYKCLNLDLCTILCGMHLVLLASRVFEMVCVDRFCFALMG